MNSTWWKESVVYQIYPRSFNDTNGDGIGDLQGVHEKLDYIKSLGVDVIWLCPVYESPNDDNGYDISDYRKIMTDFGTQADFDVLLAEIHRKGMKLVMDLVANHTSDEHYWFEEAKKSKDNPYRDYYIWRDGKNEGPPNNWQSIFKGSAWRYNEATDDYFLHLFTKKQPDLNWENPKVRKEIYAVIKYWLDKGVDGFRMDVISLISKQLDFPDATTPNFNEVITKYYANGPKVHTYLNEMNKEVLSKYDIMTVGEGPGINLANGLDYVHSDRDELNMVFHFDHMYIDCGEGGKYDPIAVDLVRFKEVFTQWDEKLKGKGWGSIYLGNHDFSRMVSRFGNAKNYHFESATLLCSLLCSMRGTVYIYQGDEIGMTNVAFPTIDYYNDVETLNSWKEAEDNGQDMNAFLKLVHMQSRDNARTPMQWNEQDQAGFTEGQPWLKVNPNYKSINVASQNDSPNSILNFYRRMIAYRKKNKTMVYGDYKCLDEKNDTFYAYERWDEKSSYIIVHNFSDNRRSWDYPISWSEYVEELSNYNQNGAAKMFKPWQTKIFVKSR